MQTTKDWCCPQELHVSRYDDWVKFYLLGAFHGKVNLIDKHTLMGFENGELRRGNNRT
jgi:hypothetical protein